MNNLTDNCEKMGINDIGLVEDAQTCLTNGNSWENEILMKKAVRRFER